MSEMFRRVRDSIAAAYAPEMSGVSHGYAMAMAERATRAAMKAMREPTTEMVVAAAGQPDTRGAEWARQDWRNMVEAALSEEKAPA